MIGTQGEEGGKPSTKNESKTGAPFEYRGDIFSLLTLCKGHVVTHGQDSEMCIQHPGVHRKRLELLLLPHPRSYHHGGLGAVLTPGSSGSKDPSDGI